MRRRQPLTTIKRWSLGVVFVLVFSPLLGAVYTYTRGGESARVQAATSSTLNFQARLMGNTGALVSDGSYSIQFKLYDSVSGGTNEWTETQTVTVKNGYFSVYLGNVTPFSTSIDWSQEKWLTMNVNSDGEMTPRIKLTATPYSLRSGQADSLTISGGTVTGDNLFQKAPGAVQIVNSSNAGLRINQTGSGGLLQLQGNGSDVFTVDNSGNTTTSGSLTLGAGLTLGNSSSTTAGTLRWNGSEFEGYDGLTWKVLGSGSGGLGTPFVSKTKSANETVTASTTFQDDDQLFFPIGANETWNYRFVVQANAPAAADLKFTVTAPSGATCTFSVGDYEGAVSVANLGCGVTSGLIPGNGAADTYEIIGSVSNGATAGNLQLQWSQQVASGTTTVFRGSFVEASRSVGVSSTAVAFIQDGNTFSANAVLGTNDNYSLDFETNGVTNLTLDTTGNLNIINGALQTAGTTRITNAGVLQNVTADTDILTSGTLGVVRGGTGAAAFTNNGLLFGNGTGAIGATAAGTGGQLLIADGSGVPTFVSLSGDATLDSSGGLTIANGAIGNTKLTNSSFNVSYGSNLSGSASVSLGGTLSLALSATPSFTSVNTGTLTATGAINGATTTDTINGLIINSGTLSGITGATFTSGSLNLSTGGITNAGTVSGVAGLTLSSGNLVLGGGNISGAGSIAGTSLGVTGAISAATTVNTINGLIINSGSLSNVTGFSQTSGAFSITGNGAISLGGGSNALTIDSTNFDVSSAGAISGITSISASGAISAATTTNTINGLVINSGALTSVTGITFTSGGLNLNSGGITNAGSIGGVAGLTFTSGNLSLGGGNITGAGSISGTSLSVTGVISANTTNSINGLSINAGSLSGITGFNQTSGNFSVTGTGSITVGGGSNALTIDSTNFDVSSAGALSGITTLNASGALTAATATNTLNGLVVNSGSLSSITGFTQGSGNFNMSGTGTFGTGSGNVSLNGATTIATAVNSATALTVNGTTGTAADALRIAQTGNAANLIMSNTARTTGALVSLTQNTSAFTGTGLLFNFASGSGSFAAGNFLDFQLNGASRFKVDNTGALQINTDSASALQIRSSSGALSYLTVNNSGNLIQIGSSTADATSILLALDQGTSDPTGVNGGMYYNSTNNKNRCFENGVWTDCLATAIAGETTLGAANATINVTLNGNFEYLHCRVDVKGRSAASFPYLRFNNDTGAAAYGWNMYGITAATVVDAQDSSDSEIQLASATGTIPFSADINITNFDDTRKAVEWTGIGAEAVGTNMNRYSGGGVWGNATTQVSSVQFVASTGTFATGSHAWCEGRNVR